MKEGKKVVDTPVNADLEHAISSNWAYDHKADVDAHHEAQPTNYKAMAHPSAAQAIVTATATKITLDTEDYDPNANFANSRYTVAKAGYYLILGAVGITGLATDKYLQVLIYKNGSAVAYSMGNSSGAGWLSIPVVAILSLAVGDYIELYCLHNHGSDRDTVAANCFLAIHLISAE